MARMWLWNSITTRSRSGSDVFLDNGVAILRTHLARHGHEIHVEDWASIESFQSFSPPWLTRPIRALYRRAAAASPRAARRWGALALPLQSLLTAIQARRMNRRLDDLVERFLASGAKVFGIKVWYGEAFTWSKRLARKILARDPSMLVLAGGYHATMYEADILRDSPFDLAAISEGEFVLTEILDAVDRHLPAWDKPRLLAELAGRAGRGELTNLAYRQDGAVRLTERAPHHLDDKVIPDYRGMEHKLPVHVLCESVGCAWGQCHFCVHTHFNGKYRPRPVPAIVAEMQELARQGVALFRFAESDTPAPRGARIARAILDAGLEVEYVIGNRAVRGAKDPQRQESLVEQYGLMIRSGLRAIFMGGETGNDWANEQVMNKGVLREDVIWTCRAIQEACRRTGLVCDLVLALIYPMPTLGGVTLEQVFDDNLSLVREVRPDVVHPNPPAPLVASQWYREPQRFGWDLGPGFIPAMMEYEFCLYKPTSLWPPIEVSLEGRDFHAVMAECDRFRRALEAEGLNTNLSDEHCAMMRVAGYAGHEGARRFRRESFLDIASCDYRMIGEVCRRVAAHSRELAARSVRRMSAPVRAAAEPAG